MMCLIQGWLTGSPGFWYQTTWLPTRGGAEQIDFAVAVDVGGVDGAGLGDVVLDDMFDPLPVPVFVPDELVAFAPVGSGDIEIAVAVEVGHCDIVGAGQGAFVDVVVFP